MKSTRGFTLLEVLVALAIIAIAMGAIVKGVSQNVSNAVYLRDKSLAHWVALNQIAEIQLAPGWPEAGTTDGKAEMAGHEWRWRAKVEETFDPDVRRLEVEVMDGARKEGGLDKVTAFLPRPSP